MIEKFVVRFIFIIVIYVGLDISINRENSYTERIIAASFSMFAANLLLETV
jgi:hypothetical protein